ncbi:hypothetical protein BH10ACI3_BH10ACI3_24220 [soil metagenome]
MEEPAKAGTQNVLTKMVENKPNHSLAVLGFSVLLLLPSIDTVLKYSGDLGIVAYIAAGTAAIFFCQRYVLPVNLSKIRENHAIFITILIFLALIVIVTIGYPIANSGTFGAGGDVDDAMISAANDVVHGIFPYYKRTYLGLLISPMPGAIFFAIPFVLLSALQYQNIFWLGALFVTVRSQLKSGVAALGVLVTLLLFSPTVYHGLVTGSDYISNTIYIIIAMWLMVTTLSDPESPLWKKLLPTMLLGVGLSSRTNFMLLLPLFLSVLVQTAGWREAVKYIAISLVVCFAVTIPFWLYDPAGFAPLISQASKVRELESFLPFAGVLIPGSTLLLSIALSFQKMERDCAVFFRNSAIVQLFVLLFTSIVFALQRGQVNFYMAHAGYGMFVLFFAVLAAWITILKHAETPVSVEA